MKARHIWVGVALFLGIAVFAEEASMYGIMWNVYSILRATFAGAMTTAMGLAVVGIIVSFYDN